ncbi:hypothetical protein HMPREF1624_07874 [Sporothrix schenckii ATCC 58251]|uniref:JmjC domain-containing protein n=1 Tax=Sporothrix schenckii (strain ATCC 58251 / de Perez 2211183) TaxID=1391915 RepID=U7PJH2_SPOS1|nr:hypothetical protein HMPREF1624_07874 [Sporothrix schenckii ATCC 58251]
MDPVAELITSYFELNGSIIDELDNGGSEPSPLEFMRYVARNTPFVIRGGASAWPAAQTWSVPFLRKTLADHTVNVAVTPNGYADAPTPGPDGDAVFAKPWEEDQTFVGFVDYVVRQEKGQLPEGAETRYAQTQNDNLRHEYASVFAHVQKDIPFARIALQRAPEAINLWIGNSHSVTAMHRDNYENIYVQILGQKHFVLLPPLCQPCVNEQYLPQYSYAPSDGGLTLAPEGADGPNNRVPFAVWDPDAPSANTTPYSGLAEPMRVTLNPGDMLYLPAMWYHKVSQTASDEGICVAVNYWYGSLHERSCQTVANTR